MSPDEQIIVELTRENAGLKQKIHLASKGGHVARAGFDTEERMKLFLSSLKKGDWEQAKPLYCGIDLQDDFRPFLGKKLRLVYRATQISYYEEA